MTPLGGPVHRVTATARGLTGGATGDVTITGSGVDHVVRGRMGPCRRVDGETLRCPVTVGAPTFDLQLVRVREPVRLVFTLDGRVIVEAGIG